MSDLVEVWRMEDANGFGPFRAPFDHASFATHVGWAQMVGDELVGDAAHPHHMDDVFGGQMLGALFGLQLALQGDWTVGVQDADQLLHWFPPASLPYFESIGQRISLYCVPLRDVKPGRWQLLFRRETARLLETILPTGGSPGLSAKAC